MALTKSFIEKAMLIPTAQDKIQMRALRCSAPSLGDVRFLGQAGVLRAYEPQVL